LIFIETKANEQSSSNDNDDSNSSINTTHPNLPSRTLNKENDSIWEDPKANKSAINVDELKNVKTDQINDSSTLPSLSFDSSMPGLIEKIKLDESASNVPNGQTINFKIHDSGEKNKEENLKEIQSEELQAEVNGHDDTDSSHYSANADSTRTNCDVYRFMDEGSNWTAKESDLADEINTGVENITVSRLADESLEWTVNNSQETTLVDGNF
jgi:hypothetical protein